MVLTKRGLGVHYVLGTGIVLGLLVSVTLLHGSKGPAVVLSGGLGVSSAAGLTGTGFWLRDCRMHGEQIWRIATHAGVGIGVVTVTTLLVLAVDAAVPLGSSEVTILASTIAIGGTGGAVVGLVREFDRSTTTLTQSTEVLSRALRHNLRNDMTIVLGHLDQLEAEVAGPPSDRIEAVRSTIERVNALSEKAQQIEVAVTGERRSRQPIEAVTIVSRRIEVLRATHPEATVETDLPATAWVSADWMLGTAVENVLETTVENGGERTELEISIDQSERGWTVVRFVDRQGVLPEGEIATLNSGTETPLQHSEGLSLWLVRWIVESYGGRLDLARDDDTCVVTMRLPRSVPARSGDC